MFAISRILFAGLMIVCLCGGCATVVRGDSQKIKFETDPAGATLKVADKTFTTPATVELKRKQAYDVLISKEGFQPVSFKMESQWDGASIPGVILPGGSLMIATDRTTGADLAFYEPPVIKLDPASAGTEPKEMVLYRKHLLTRAEYDKAKQEEQTEAFRHRED